MKYKKYIIFIMLIMLFGINRINANTVNNINIASTSLTANTVDLQSNKIYAIKKTTSSNRSTSCDGLFGRKDDPNSLRYLINEILMYPKIIVPILVIGLGTLDLAKAVVSSKEDEMKKAQKTFVKRVIIGIMIYLVPVIMNVIMYLADIVWNGAFTTCGI